jgi:hypothetical protein
LPEEREMSQYTIDEILAQLEAWYAEQRQKDPDFQTTGHGSIRHITLSSARERIAIGRISELLSMLM